jgi:hypothetical protein
LNQYDTGHFPKGGLSKGLTEEISVEEAMYAVNNLKEKLITLKEATALLVFPAYPAQTGNEVFKIYLLLKKTFLEIAGPGQAFKERLIFLNCRNNHVLFPSICRYIVVIDGY